MISLARHADVYNGLLGGALIGASSSMLLLMTGKISGMSGIVAQALRSKDTNGDAWHSFVDKSITSLCYIAGLLVAGYAMRNKRPEVFGDGGSMEPYNLNMLGIATAAFLVGFGTRLGNGCTSGHGVCGLPRRSKRSLAAVMTFMATGMVSAYIMRVYGATTWPLNTLLASSPVVTEASIAALLTDTQGRTKSILALALSAFIGHLLMRYATTSNTTATSEAPKSLQELALAKADTVGSFHLHIYANLTSFICGALFGVGLCLSGMTDRSRVYHFLDIFNTITGWDPTLAGVMGGAVTLNVVTFELFNRAKLMPFLLKLKLSKGVLSSGKSNSRQEGNNDSIDNKCIHNIMDPKAAISTPLLFGSALFGAGWGLGGMCPGPALVSIMAPDSQVALFFCCVMFITMGFHSIYDKLASGPVVKHHPSQKVN